MTQVSMVQHSKHMEFKNLLSDTVYLILCVSMATSPVEGTQKTEQCPIDKVFKNNQ